MFRTKSCVPIKFVFIVAVSIACALVVDTPVSYAVDSWAYAPGNTCIPRNDAHARLLKKRFNRIENRSENSYLQVYCSSTPVRFPSNAAVRFIVYGKQAQTALPFRATFRILRPDDGMVLDKRVVTADNSPNSLIQVRADDPLTTTHCCVYNQAHVYIPPKSTLYTVYTNYVDP